MKSLSPQADWDVRRFRPNLVIETSPDFEGLAEQSWVGRRLRISGAMLTAAGATPRCGATTRAQQGLAFDATILRAVVRETEQNVGIYCEVEKGATLRVGDTVSLMDP